jgi:hypothetical protein
MAKDWTKERSATDMARASLADKTKQSAVDKLEDECYRFSNLLEETSQLIEYETRLHALGNRDLNREPFIECLFEAEKMLRTGIIVLRVQIDKLKD